MQATPDALAKTMDQLERGPVGFVAAFFALAFAWLLFRHLAVVSKLHADYESKMERIHAGELHRAVQLEATMRGLEELVEGLLSGAVRVRRGRPVTDPGLEAEPHPTQSMRAPVKPGGGSDGQG